MIRWVLATLGAIGLAAVILVWCSSQDAEASRAVNGQGLGATSGALGTIDLVEPPFAGAAGGWQVSVYRAAGGMTGCTAIKMGTAAFASISSPDDQHCNGVASANPSVSGGLAGTSGLLTASITTPAGVFQSGATTYSHFEYVAENEPIASAHHTSIGLLTDAGHVYRWKDLTPHGNDYTRLDAGSLEPAQGPAWNGTPYPSVTCATSDLEMHIDGGIDSGSFATLAVVQNHTTSGITPSVILAGGSGAVFTYNDWHNINLSDGVFAITGGQSDTAPHVLGLSMGLDAGGGQSLNRIYLDNAIGEGDTRTFPINSGRPNRLCVLPSSYYGGATTYANSDVQAQIVWDTTSAPIAQVDIENAARILAEFANVTLPTYPAVTVDAGGACTTTSCNAVFFDDFNGAAPADGGTGVDYSKWVVENSLTFTNLPENAPIWPFCGTAANVIQDGGVLKLSLTNHARAAGACPTFWDAGATGNPLDAGTIYDVGQVIMRPDKGIAPPFTLEVRAQMGTQSTGAGSVIWMLGSACAGANQSVFAQLNQGQVGLTACFWSDPPLGENDVAEIEGIVNSIGSDIWTNNGYHPSAGWTTTSDPSQSFFVYTAVHAADLTTKWYAGSNPGGSDKVLKLSGGPNINTPYFPMSVILSEWGETNQPGENTDAASLPQSMYVDYVLITKP